jgi:hypothetical protein
VGGYQSGDGARLGSFPALAIYYVGLPRERGLIGRCDTAALRLCLERILPPRRDRPISFDLPKIESVANALSASSAVIASCAAGALSPRDAAEIMGLVSTHIHMLELTEIEARLTSLEKGLKP